MAAATAAFEATAAVQWLAAKEVSDGAGYSQPIDDEARTGSSVGSTAAALAHAKSRRKKIRGALAAGHASAVRG